MTRAHATLALLACMAMSTAWADDRVIQVVLGKDNAVRAGEPVELQVRVRDPASGYPLTGLTPALWLMPAAGVDVNEDCERRVNRLAASAVAPRGVVEVNGFDVVQAVAGGRLALVDPLLNLGSANIKAMLDLGAAPNAWALESDERSLAVVVPGSRSLRRIDMSDFRIAQEVLLPAEATALVEVDGALWAGLSDGRLFAVDGVGDPPAVPLGEGPVRLVALDEGALAVARSGDAAFLHAGRIARHFRFPGRVAAIGFAALSDSGYALSEDGRTVWIAPRDAPEAVIEVALDRRMRSLATDPQGKWLALVSADGRAVAILDTRRQRVRWTVEVDDPVIAADFSDAFLYLMHARRGGATRVVFDPLGGPPGLVSIAAGSANVDDRTVGALPMIARIPGMGVLLASYRDRIAYMISDDNAQAAMSSLPLRAGAPTGLLLRYRGLQPASERGTYRARVALPRGGDYVAVVRTSQPDFAHCMHFSVAPASGESPQVAQAAGHAAQPMPERLLETRLYHASGSKRLHFAISGSASFELLGASLVGDGWQQMPAEIERSDGGYSIPAPAAPVSPYVLFVRYRDGEATRILASAVGDEP